MLGDIFFIFERNISVIQTLKNNFSIATFWCKDSLLSHFLNLKNWAFSAMQNILTSENRASERKKKDYIKNNHSLLRKKKKEILLKCSILNTELQILSEALGN